MFCFYNQLLKVAVIKENLEDIKFSLLKGADVNQRLRPFNETYLHLSLSIDIMEELIKSGADVNARDRYGHTPLYSAIANKKELRIIQILIASGADVNCRDINGETPLHCAIVDSKQLPVIKELLRHHIDVNATDNSGKTALELVVRSGKEENLEVVKELMEYGADIVVNNQPTVLYEAIDRGFQACTELLLKMSVLKKIDMSKLIKWIQHFSSAVFNKLLEYLDKCLCEFVQLKTDKVSCYYSLYEYVRKKGDYIKPFYPSFQIIDEDIALRYPVYCNIIMTNIKLCSDKALILKKLKAIDVYTTSVDGIKIVVLNYDCICLIAEFLANDHLDNLLKAFDR